METCRCQLVIHQRKGLVFIIMNHKTRKLDQVTEKLLHEMLLQKPGVMRATFIITFFLHVRVCDYLGNIFCNLKEVNKIAPFFLS